MRTLAWRKTLHGASVSLFTRKEGASQRSTDKVLQESWLQETGCDTTVEPKVVSAMLSEDTMYQRGELFPQWLHC